MKNQLFKALSIAVVVLLSTATLLAAPSHGIYHLRAGKNHAFAITVDGQRVPELRREHVLNLTSGLHRIKVRIPPPANAPWMRYRTIYKGNIEVKPNTETFAYIDRHGNLLIHQETAIQTTPPRNSHSSHQDNPYRTDTPPNQPNDDDAYYEQNRPNTPYGYDDDDDDIYNNGGYQSPATTPRNMPTPPSAMPASKLTELKDILRSKSFDDERLAIAKQAISAQQPISSEQLRELLTVFAFEQSRLDFAKYARPYVTDPNNFQVIYSEFKFSSSIQELTK